MDSEYLLESLEKDRENVYLERERIEEEVKTLQAEFSNFEERKHEIKSRIQELRNRSSSFRSLCEENNAKIKMLSADLKALKDVQRAFRVGNTRIEEETRHSDSEEYEKLQKNIDSLAEEIAQLKNEITMFTPTDVDKLEMDRLLEELENTRESEAEISTEMKKALEVMRKTDERFMDIMRRTITVKEENSGSGISSIEALNRLMKCSFGHVDDFEKPVLPVDIPDIRDAYDAVDNFGTDTEDYDNAYYQILKSLSEATDPDYFTNDKNKAYELFRHFNNLIIAFENAVRTDDTERINEMKFVLEALFYYGGFDDVERFVERYYRKYREICEECVPLDFREMFIHAGDVCLFNYRNIYHASSFYSFAALDWSFGKDPSRKVPHVFDWDDSSYRYTILAMGSLALWEQEYGNKDVTKFIVDPRYLTEKVEFSLDFRYCNDFKKDAFEEHWTVLNSLIDIYSDMDCGLKIDKSGIEYRLFTGMLLLGQAKYLLQYLNQLYEQESEPLNDEVADILSLILYSTPIYFSFSDLRQYVAKKVPEFIDWCSINRIDLSRYKEVFIEVLKLARCKRLCNHTQDLLRAEVDENTRIAYYTKYSSLGYFLWNEDEKKDGHLPLFHVAYMNDPNEGKTLFQFLNVGIDKSEMRTNARQPYIFLKCFTNLIDDLPMWNMYGDGGKGVCIVLNGLFYRPEKDYKGFKESTVVTDLLNRPRWISVPLYRVCYLRKVIERYEVLEDDNATINSADLDAIRKNLDEIKRLLDSDDSREWFEESIGEIKYLFKDAAYSHEQETRIIESTSPTFEYEFTDNKMAYISMYSCPAIDEIIIGPKFENKDERVTYIQIKADELYHFKNHNMKSPKITFSSIDYR